MSPPPYMPLWIGDYLRDTQHLSCEQHGAYMLLIMYCWQHGALPPDDTSRAQIARLFQISRWKKIKPAVEAFFEPDGTHRRVTKERARVEHLTTVRAVAGSKGGLRTAASKTPSKSRSPPQANRQANSQPNSTANAHQKSSTAQAYQTKNQNLTSSSESAAARATPTEVPETQDKSAGELATALRGGALTRPPDAAPAATPASKHPSDVTRDDWETIFAAKRAAEERPE